MEHSQPGADELTNWVSDSAHQALGYAYSLVHNRQAAEDLVQDCYCRLLSKAKVYDLPKEGTRLLYRAITNACINWTQRNSPAARSEHLQQSVDERRLPVASQSSVEPLQIAIQRELEQVVDAALVGLPVEQRAAIELRSIGHSLIDVAEILNTTHGNARVLLHRARVTLAERLRPYLEENSP